MRENRTICTVVLPNGEECELPAEQEDRFLDEIKSASLDYWSDSILVQRQNQSDGWLYIYRDMGLGWLLTCLGKSDTVEHFLVRVGESLGESVRIVKSGVLDEYRMGQFVPFEIARPAIKYFLQHSERDPSLRWLRIDEV
jgi:hypothetical protein